jgi:hypothetical protein
MGSPAEIAERSAVILGQVYPLVVSLIGDRLDWCQKYIWHSLLPESILLNARETWQETIATSRVVARTDSAREQTSELKPLSPQWRWRLLQVDNTDGLGQPEHLKRCRQVTLRMLGHRLRNREPIIPVIVADEVVEFLSPHPRDSGCNASHTLRFEKEGVDCSLFFLADHCPLFFSQQVLI